MYETAILNFEEEEIEIVKHKEKDFLKTKFIDNYNLSNIEFMTKKGEFKIK